MVIDLKRFFQNDGLSQTEECELNMSGMELGGVKPFCAPVKAHAELKSFAGSVSLKTDVGYTLSMPCDRCGEETVKSYSQSYSHSLVRELNAEEDDDDYIVVPDERLDLDELITEDIVLDMPGKFLCSPDCKGVCPTCGKNLNEGDCDCERDDIDPRLAKLRELLNDS